jgi:putative ABC transport system permease protein
MIGNYIKIAFRNLMRNKAFSFINIFGLAVGLATCLLILLYILDESSYDQHIKDGDRIYRIVQVAGKDGGTWGGTWAAAAAPVAWALKADMPQVEQVTRLMTLPELEKMALTYDNHSVRKQFLESNGYYVDSTFFQLFTYEFVRGNPLTALNEPNSMVISEQMAHQFFGQEDPLGKSILINTSYGEFNYTVKGVFDNTRYKSHIPAHFFLSMRNNDMWNYVKDLTNWSTNNIFYTYVKLKEGSNPATFAQQLNPFYQRRGGSDLKAAGSSQRLFTQPLKSIYLHSALGNEIAPNGNITYLYILGSIAAFILVIACINFMNLSTARSEKRAREVGVRKVVGAGRSSLIFQFMGESFLMCLLALALAILLAEMFLPLFSQLTQKELHVFDQPVLILWIGGLTLFTGLLSGIYPAFYLSAFNPVSVLKGKIANSFSATAIRKGLVIFQFTISICLVLGAIVIWRQLAYLKDRNPGFAKDQQIVLPLGLDRNNADKHYIALRDELLKKPQVRKVTGGSTYPGIPNINDLLFYPVGKTANEQVDIHLANVEDDYIQTLGLTILSGRGFSKDFSADSDGIVLNEVAVKALGFEPDNAIGKTVQSDFRSNHFRLRIIGVLKDFNFESLHRAIEPFGFTANLFGGKHDYLIANLNTNDYAGLLKDIEKSWHALIPNAPFTYSFVDQDFQRNYEKDRLTSRIVIDFTVIAILIACLGLFGLAAFAAERRAKEIGIRKVLGASVASVTLLLSKDFIRLVLVAIVIASPIAWMVMHQWLASFAYRVDISWWMFAVAGLLAVLIALATVSFQAVKTGLMNPAESLKAE